MASILFGGTFDPPHLGHERLVDLLRAAFPGVPIELLPCFQPVHKAASGTSASHRVAMVERLAARWDDVSVNTVEVASASPRYTLDTLTEWRRTVSASEPLIFALGGDSLARLHTWSRWERLLDLAHLVVLPRPGFSEPPSSGVVALLERAELPYESRHQLLSQPAGHVVTLPGEALPWSSTDLRQNRQNWQAALPTAVLDYIQRENLYDTAGGT